MNTSPSTLVRPMPRPTRISAPFWQALAEHRIAMQHCRACQQWVWYPRPHCPRCGGRELQWQTMSGDATLYSFCISPRPTAPEFSDEVPQQLALVELAEGPRLTTTLVGSQPWQIGMPLQPVFDDDGPITLLRFEAVSDPSKESLAAGAAR